MHALAQRIAGLQRCRSDRCGQRLDDRDLERQPQIGDRAGERRAWSSRPSVRCASPAKHGSSAGEARALAEGLDADAVAASASSGI